MTDTMIIEFLAFAGSLCAIIIPVGRALNNYTARLERLVERIENMEKNFTKQNDEISERVRTQGKEIDELAVRTENHEVRILGLEKRDEK